jgi:hypothetical protein
MLGFYEELADLAAMSEDDGFLGQCAGSELEKAAPDEQNSLSGLPAAKFLRRRPLQLRLSPSTLDSDLRT